MRKRLFSIFTSLAVLSSLTACSSNNGENASLVIYSGRTQEYIASVFEDFTAETGIRLDVRYGDSAALAAQILEEGENSPADLFISQDAGALGAVSSADLFSKLNKNLLNRVGEYFRSPASDWVALTGRVRILAYAPDRVANLPKTVDDLIKPEWKGLSLAAWGMLLGILIFSGSLYILSLTGITWLGATIAERPRD